VLGVDPDCQLTPAMLRKVVYAGSQSASFRQAALDLKALAEAEVSAQRIRRATERIGDERVAQVEAAAESYQQLPLPERRTSPVEVVPHVACVQMDGGRIQIRDRRAASPPEDVAGKGHWRETLVGCLLSMTSQASAEDPCPTIPPTFVDPRRMGDLSREIKGFSGEAEGAAEPPEAPPEERPGRPQPLVKSVVATRQGIEALGRRLVASAHARGFSAAQRKAFVADGAAANWSVHSKHFSHYTPILDFTHAVCYVYAAALAGRSLHEAWPEYCQWAQWLWDGHVEALVAAVAGRSQALGPPQEDDPETSPRQIVARTLGYLQNQRARMHYPQYRRQGLPITSSHVESTVKQINRRVKGTEKFWDQGAEPLLQLAADHLSETRDLDRFWKKRPPSLQSMRCYHAAA
jgi:hypothetical protein